ncbi:MAG: FtsH-binding integral membrane protein [Roseivirga sp.]|jgi:FtsH-binding integral membrane protein
MSENKNNFAFGKENYKWMLIGLAVLLSGFVIMSLDNTQHGQGFLGLTLGPIVIIAGFVLQFFAIFKKDKKTK